MCRLLYVGLDDFELFLLAHFILVGSRGSMEGNGRVLLCFTATGFLTRVVTL